MSPRSCPTRLRASRRGARLTALLAAAAVLSGCAVQGDSVGAQALRTGWPSPITPQGERMLNLYVGAWLAAAVVGVAVWGLMFFAAVRYRKRDDLLPRQVRYNLPVEVLYTVVPFVIVAVLFYYTAIIQSDVDSLSEDPDETVGVVGFQWNWQFVYPGEDGEEDLRVTGRPGEPAVMYLPTGRTIQFVETSPDVIHSFWVPAFLFKRDVIPGRENRFELTINEGAEGSYIGRCAELCGTDHDRMNFEVRAVSGEEYDSLLAGFRSAGGEVFGDPSSPAAGGANGVVG